MKASNWQAYKSINHSIDRPYGLLQCAYRYHVTAIQIAVKQLKYSKVKNTKIKQNYTKHHQIVGLHKTIKVRYSNLYKIDFTVSQ